MTSTKPVRINKYLADQGQATRRGADELVSSGKVYINGRPAVLGDTVAFGDRVEVRGTPERVYQYYAYYKPRGIATEDIPLPAQGLFPLGRLDKASRGLIILTDDGRLTDRLLSPDRAHEKEYAVRVREQLPADFKKRMENGVRIDGGYTTRKCTVTPSGNHAFSIILTEGKKHQIRRMCEAFRLTVLDLERVRIMTIRGAGLKDGEHRIIRDTELSTLLKTLGL